MKNLIVDTAELVKYCEICVPHIGADEESSESVFSVLSCYVVSIHKYLPPSSGQEDCLDPEDRGSRLVQNVCISTN